MIRNDNSNNDFIRVLSTYSNAINLLQKRTRISSETLLYTLGEFFGNALANEISANKIDEVLKKTFSIWKKEGLGRASIEQHDPLTITIRDCHGCDQEPNSSETLDCRFREGMLTAIIDSKLGSKSMVKYISSYGKVIGKKRCWFVVMETNKDQKSSKKKGM